MGDALAHYGRIFKTLHVLSDVDERALPRRDQRGMRNLQEGRHDLARTMFHGRKGELRHGYREGMEDQLGALGLILNTITLWNTVPDRRPRQQSLRMREEGASSRGEATRQPTKCSSSRNNSARTSRATTLTNDRPEDSRRCRRVHSCGPPRLPPCSVVGRLARILSVKSIRRKPGS
jgi:Tn3 transposase DDE domain